MACALRNDPRAGDPSGSYLLALFILASLEPFTLGCLKHADIAAGSSGAPSGQPSIETRDGPADTPEDVHRDEVSESRTVAWASVWNDP
jgi:hypothetical protein